MYIYIVSVYGEITSFKSFNSLTKFSCTSAHKSLHCKEEIHTHVRDELCCCSYTNATHNYAIVHNTCIHVHVHVHTPNCEKWFVCCIKLIQTESVCNIVLKASGDRVTMAQFM